MSREAPLPAVGVLIAAVVASVLAIVLPPRAAAAQERSWESYRVLVERNIFLRNRRAARTRGPSATTMRAVYDSDRDFVLTGIGRRNGETVAFFENTRTQTTTRVSIGQAVGKGAARAITLDSVEYERGGAVTRIEIGYALQGGRFVRETVAASTPVTTAPDESSVSTTGPATASSQPAPEETPTPSGSGADSGDVSDILRQMRQRREQELRK